MQTDPRLTAGFKVAGLVNKTWLCVESKFFKCGECYYPTLGHLIKKDNTGVNTVLNTRLYTRVNTGENT